ncbi:2-amino-4-hydroxy-6-hydroxymethyldihydropteridine diphosphokinase [Dyadobacter sp. 32]|uniref:2-amino-4-hydroxy-6- hydroxymethyldihydropteridine diphosphokinase n=1 Tax=Dyadobacter sp. 32 TaxID=538966 RepID=UPI0011F00D22
MPDKHVLYLLLGANLGDRMQSFRSAKDLIEARVGCVILSSSVYETAPWGVLDQPSFLNQVLAVETVLAPLDILSCILSIEKELGRVRLERWAARMIDIDMLYYDDLVLDVSHLTIPHPRLQDRRFTLAPLAEISPEFCHPLLKRTNQQLLSDCPDDSSVFIFS